MFYQLNMKKDKPLFCVTLKKKEVKVKKSKSSLTFFPHTHTHSENIRFVLTTFFCLRIQSEYLLRLKDFATYILYTYMFSISLTLSFLCCCIQCINISRIKRLFFSFLEKNNKKNGIAS